MDAFTWSLPFASEKSEYLLFIFVAASPPDNSDGESMIVSPESPSQGAAERGRKRGRIEGV